MNSEFDAIVVGAGVIGASVARALLKQGHAKRVVVLEKEGAPALHTSGRNSGVIHSGFNLKPGTLKAQFCVDGNQRLKEFCLRNAIPVYPGGTLVVALKESDQSILDELYRRGTENGVSGLRLVNQAEIKKIEPHANGLSGLHSPNGAITSGRHVTAALLGDAKWLGAEVFYNERVVGIDPTGTGFVLRTPRHRFRAATLFNCAGLYADDVAHQMNVGREFVIIPFRGAYFKLRRDKCSLLNSMVYPTPNLNFPFLGVHWTKTIDGDAMIGPSAMLAMGRESYSVFSIQWNETFQMVRSKNFRRLWGNADFKRLLSEQLGLSLRRGLFIQEARKLISDVGENDFEIGKAGNRAQVVDQNGRMVDDMLVLKEGNSVHVLNAVSPGMTCALPFADYLIQQIFK